LHKFPLSDFELVAIKLNDKRFKRFWWRSTKHLAIRREAATMTWTKKFAGLFLPGNNATEVSTDGRKGNKVTGSRLQGNSRLPLVLEKMGLP